MSVTAFRIKNFMGFEDSGWIELRPITLLFGQNSAGKSAIMRALLLLRQSLGSKPKHEPLLFVDDDGYDLGSYKDLVRDHDLSNEICFAFQHRFSTIAKDEVERADAKRLYSAFQRLRIISSDDKDSDEVIIAELEVAFGFDEQKKKVVPNRLTVSHGGLENHRILSICRKKSADAQEQWDLYSDISSITHDRRQLDANTMLFPQIGLSNHYGFLPEITGIDEDKNQKDKQGEEQFQARTTQEDLEEYRAYLSCKNILQADITTRFLLFSHLGPVRPSPQRYYYTAGQSTKTFDLGEKDWVRSWVEAEDDRNEDDIKTERLQSLKEWFKQTFKASISAASIADKRPIYEVVINEIENRNTSSISEVGSGISQLLPILIKTAFSGINSKLLIEQPELHLHPRAQAQLGNFLIAATRRGVSFVLETHSEHLLLRLQKQIALTTVGNIKNHEESLLLNQLGVYFIHREKSVSTCSEIEIGHYGDILNTPDGFDDFFSDDMLETSERMRIRLQGKRAERQ